MQKQIIFTKTPVILLLCTVCCLLWGSAFPFVKIGYKLFEIESTNPLGQILFAGTRFFLAGVFAIVIGSLLSKKVLIPQKKNYTKILRLSAMQTVLQYIFFYIGLANTTGVKSSVINGSSTFFAILIACFVFNQERFSAKKLIGCIFGIIGIVLINFDSSLLSFSFSFLGEGFILLSSVSYAFSSAMIRQYSQSENSVILSGYQFLFGGAFMVAISLLFGARFGSVSKEAVAILIYLALLSAVAYTLWGVLLKYNSVSRITVYGFMIPVFGFFLSALILKEGYDISAKSIIALALVCAGILLVNRQNQNRKEQFKINANKNKYFSE